MHHRVTKAKLLTQDVVSGDFRIPSSSIATSFIVKLSFCQFGIKTRFEMDRCFTSLDLR